MNLTVHFSSKKQDWGTPQEFFDQLNERFNFTLDPCASHNNAKCEKFYTKEENGLEQCWQGETVFMNPPYGQEIREWMGKAFEEWYKGDCEIVCLVPARTDTRWFHDYVYDLYQGYKNNYDPLVDVEFIKGRLKFGGAKHAAPFPSMLVIYKKWR